MSFRTPQALNADMAAQQNIATDIHKGYALKHHSSLYNPLEYSGNFKKYHHFQNKINRIQ
jgi:hypothetical protein